MEKIITIDDKNVKFKSTGAVPLRYKAQFQRDYFSDIVKLLDIVVTDVKNPDDITEDDIDLGRIDLDVFYRIVWTLAKTADKNIPDLINWLDEFDNFPIIEVALDLMDIITATIQTKKKHPAQARKRKK